MKERPIIMSTDMVRAIREGRKSQTSRVIKPQPEQCPNCYDLKQKGRHITFYGGTFHCPYGQVGARLWVRETHYRWGEWAKNGFTKTGRQKWTFKARNNEVLYFDNPPSIILSNREKGYVGWFKRPSIFMPRWASRITLEITGISAERVQDISLGDIYAEGCPLEKATIFVDPADGYEIKAQVTEWFANLWDSLNAKRGHGWDKNDWVWVIGFKEAHDGQSKTG